jgi:hypothetical protein
MGWCHVVMNWDALDIGIVNLNFGNHGAKNMAWAKIQNKFRQSIQLVESFKASTISWGGGSIKSLKLKPKPKPKTKPKPKLKPKPKPKTKPNPKSKPKPKPKPKNKPKPKSGSNLDFLNNKLLTKIISDG